MTNKTLLVWQHIWPVASAILYIDKNDWWTGIRWVQSILGKIIHCATITCVRRVTLDLEINLLTWQLQQSGLNTICHLCMSHKEDVCFIYLPSAVNSQTAGHCYLRATETRVNFCSRSWTNVLFRLTTMENWWSIAGL